ncbi:hypothetical protein H5410_012936 [Solanum commersonii]|uniref:Uncharacterized protein n=1 Tax=Solanum commersonii TaxID=4109 RepID=A0A9J6AT31_SOLCO|nr:hypothetical protein H5410_012936 [Solanum commersonii]
MKPFGLGRPNQPIFKLWSELIPMAKPAHFQGQRNLESPWIFSVICNFDVTFAKNFNRRQL